VAKPVDLVIFGASGDLAHRKILPSLGRLVAREGQSVRVVGVGRSHISTPEFRDQVMKASGNQKLSDTAEWVQLNYPDPPTYGPLKEIVEASPAVLFYLATPPETFSDIVAALSQCGLAKKGDVTRRTVVEKPFGHN